MKSPNRVAILCAIVALLPGCTTASQRGRKLQQGMSVHQVRQILGTEEPPQCPRKARKCIMDYRAHTYYLEGVSMGFDYSWPEVGLSDRGFWVIIKDGRVIDWGPEEKFFTARASQP